MPPARKKVCDCGILEDASKEPDHAIRWDERLKEYYIAYERGEVFRVLVYNNLSAVANVEFLVGNSDSVRGTWSQKYIGDQVS